MVRRGVPAGSLIASAAVLFVLLIACANVANLLLARAAGRERELALRAAIGAGRGRILRQLMTESVLLALAGGLLGTGLAVAGLAGLRGLFPPDLAGIERITLNGRVLEFTIVIALLSSLVFGLLPSLQAARLDLRGLLTDGGRGNTGTRGGRMRTGLVVAEIALASVLLVCSALLVQSFLRLRAADMGFDSRDVITMWITLAPPRYETADRREAFQRQLLERLSGLPGVSAVATTDVMPMDTRSRAYRLPDRPPPGANREPSANARSVTPDYFETLRIPRRSGRAFGPGDGPDAPPVVIVNERMAAQSWPDENPIGKRIVFGDVAYDVVGVVGNTRDWGPDEEGPPVVYLASAQQAPSALNLLLRTALPPTAVMDRVREVVHSLDPDQPVYGLTTLETVTSERMKPSTAMAKVLGVLALIAFILAGVGVYGVMAYTVAQRDQEMSIRMALGAQPADVLTLVLRRGGGITVTGLAIGLFVAAGVTRFLAFFLFGVSPFSPIAFTAVPLLLAATGLVASYIPALRATRADPIRALRGD